MAVWKRIVIDIIILWHFIDKTINWDTKQLRK